jgi:hypothetical protein
MYVTKFDIRNQINILKKYGSVVSEDITTMMDDINAPSYQDMMNRLLAANVVIVEISGQSLDLGYIISQAIVFDKPLLCVYYVGMQHMLDMGCSIYHSGEFEKVSYETIDKFETCVKTFMFKHNNTFRICLMGQADTGKSIVANDLEHKFGMININPHKIIRDTLSSRKNYLYHDLNEYVQTEQSIPPELITNIIINRVIQSDCITNGFVFDDYPQTYEDTLELKKHHIMPNIVFYFEKTILNPDDSPFHTLSNHWFPDTLCIRINAATKLNDVCDTVNATVQNLLFGKVTNQINSSFFIPAALTNTQMFEDNVSALPNKNKIKFQINTIKPNTIFDLAYQIHKSCPNAQGKLQFYPMTNIHNQGHLSKDKKICMKSLSRFYQKIFPFYATTQFSNTYFMMGHIEPITYNSPYEVLDDSVLQLWQHVLQHAQSGSNRQNKIMIQLIKVIDTIILNNVSEDDSANVTPNKGRISLDPLTPVSDQMIRLSDQMTRLSDENIFVSDSSLDNESDTDVLANSLRMSDQDVASSINPDGLRMSDKDAVSSMDSGDLRMSDKDAVSSMDSGDLGMSDKDVTSSMDSIDSIIPMDDQITRQSQDIYDNTIEMIYANSINYDEYLLHNHPSTILQIGFELSCENNKTNDQTTMSIPKLMYEKCQFYEIDTKYWYEIKIPTGYRYVSNIFLDSIHSSENSTVIFQLYYILYVLRHILNESNIHSDKIIGEIQSVCGIWIFN